MPSMPGAVANVSKVETDVVGGRRGEVREVETQYRQDFVVKRCLALAFRKTCRQTGVDYPSVAFS